MKILKRIQILVLILLPVCLMGMDNGYWIEADKLGKNVTIEWHKATDYKTSFAWAEKLTPIMAEVFADEPRDLRAFLLDDTLQVKKEYANIVKSFSPEEREELDWKISISDADRELRVEAIKQRLQKQNEPAKAHFQEQDPITTFVVVAKNNDNDLLGFAIFRLPPNDTVASLVLLGVAPSAQGKGLARSLVFSILKLMPTTKYISLCTEIWNTKAQAVYTKLGFTVCRQKGSYVSFEYEVKK